MLLAIVIGVLVSSLELQYVSAQRRAGAGAAAAGAAGMMGASAGMANLLNPMGPGRPFVPGMTANQVSDLMGGRPGPVPMDIANEAAALRMAGWTPDQIADVLGDKLQMRFGNPMLALAMSGAAMPGGTPQTAPGIPQSQPRQPAPTAIPTPTPRPKTSGVVSRGATKSPPAQRPPRPSGVGQPDALGVISRMPGMMLSPDMFGMMMAGAAGVPVMPGASGPPAAAAGVPVTPGTAGAPAGAAGANAGMANVAGYMLNPMGPGRPFVPGMTPNQVSDLMGGRPGPVPMDIAQEAAALRMAGWSPDQIADVLGDKLSRRYSNPFRGAIEISLMNSMTGGAQNGALNPFMTAMQGTAGSGASNPMSAMTMLV